MGEDERGLLQLLRRPDLPPEFERWRVHLAPLTARATSAAEWAGALVLVEAGTLEVECRAGGFRTFRAGDLLALGWLPLRTLHNRFGEPVRLLAVRRRGHAPRRSFLHVMRPAEARDGAGRAG